MYSDWTRFQMSFETYMREAQKIDDDQTLEPRLRFISNEVAKQLRVELRTWRSRDGYLNSIFILATIYSSKRLRINYEKWKHKVKWAG
jgi:hypothetical protein